MKHILFFSSLPVNQFLGSFRCFVFYSLCYEFFTLLVEMDTATVFLMGDCLKYVNDLEWDGLDDSMI